MRFRRGRVGGGEVAKAFVRELNSQHEKCLLVDDTPISKQLLGSDHSLCGVHTQDDVGFVRGGVDAPRHISMFYDGLLVVLVSHKVEHNRDLVCLGSLSDLVC